MKKTLTVNLGGIVFHIDEDAYALLDKYLANLRIHFGHEEGTDEIMSDFETRISELFNERLQGGFSVITIAYVEEVIGRMGRPEEIFDESANREGAKEGQPTAPTGKARKRLMRDMDDHILGGVASGLAAYFGCDVMAMRLLLIVLLILPIPIPVVLIYIILWMVTPVARTAADKLIMRGESVTLENLGRTVTDSFDRMNDYLHSDKSRTTLQKIGDFIVTFVGILLKIGVFLIAIVMIPALLITSVALLIVAVTLIVVGIESPLFGHQIDIMYQLPEYLPIMGSIAGILLVGIPLVVLTHAFFGTFMKLNPLSSGTKWTLFILWIIALTVSIVTGCMIIGSDAFCGMSGCGEWFR
ncbi:MAG: PspC domain-containing protein [Tannerella sp.]|jgi:phage shock protein PspC (stress-responsive transcriptional regulator)|nr:PspC domain-containing protein [Tannerella sp.]